MRTLRSVHALFVLLFCTSGYGASNVYINDTVKLKANENHHFVFMTTESLLSPNDPEFSSSIYQLNDSCLTIKFAYGGGCGNVYLKLFVDTSLFEMERTLVLKPHFIDKDFCEAYIQRKASFDLTALKNLFEPPIRLRLGNFEETIK